MSSGRKRLLTYAGLLVAIVIAAWILVAVVDTDGYIGSLAPNVALNWLGILVTVFSLSVTFFLAVMAIEAFSHMGFLRDATDRYDELIKRLEVDEKRFETSRAALDNYNTEMLALVDFYIQQSDLSENEKLQFSQRFQIARARLELTNAPLAADEEIDEVIRHVLVLSEHGRVSDLKFALNALKELNDPTRTHELAGEIIRELKRRKSNAPFAKADV